MVCEQHTRQVPVVTYHTVQEVRCCKVPVCVTTQVPFTVDRCVPRTVCKTIPVTCTQMVSKCVPRQVAYEVCRVVPVTVCNQPECPSCGGGCASGDCGNSSLPPSAIPPQRSAPPKPSSGVTPTYGTDLPDGPLKTIPPANPPQPKDEQAPQTEAPGPKV
jgi:hypothetical protein